MEPEDFMRLALHEAAKSPLKPTNYCVGALLVEEPTCKILATGYTLELSGNTHAEQCCLQKLADMHKVAADQVGAVMPPQTVLYTTMEPCVERLSGNTPCVDRVIQTRACHSVSSGITKVYVGVYEPDTFVQANSGRAKLEAAGIACIHVPGLEAEILAVATAGHHT